ncbi:lipopolysaccharide kinase InaA family protein [Verrucomicrobiaceae bacterium 227]
MNHRLVSPTLSGPDLTEIESALAAAKGEVIYQQGDQTITRFQAAGRDLVSKSYRLTSLKQKFVALFRYSRARRSFRAGQRLVSAGMATPHPFLLKESGGLLPQQSLLVTEFCDHPSLLDLIKSGHPLPPALPVNILKVLHQLVAIRCGHGDFHARNILIAPNGAVHLIDLDGMQYRHRSSEVTRHSIKDRDRLLRSLAPLPDQHACFAKILGAPGKPLPALSS